MISKGEALFALHCRVHGMTPVAEYRFHPMRMWRFDFAFPDRKIAVEIEGGIFTGGRHTRGRAFIEDCVKYNTAAAMGWFVFRFDTDTVKSGAAAMFMKSVIDGSYKAEAA